MNAAEVLDHDFLLADHLVDEQRGGLAGVFPR